MLYPVPLIENPSFCALHPSLVSPYHLMLVQGAASELLAVFLMAVRMRHGEYLCSSQACDLGNARGHCIKLHRLCIAEHGLMRGAHIWA